jgi:hypothetical protein
MDMLEANPAVKVVVFDSADEEYFIAHFDGTHVDHRGDPRPGPWHGGGYGWINWRSAGRCNREEQLVIWTGVLAACFR